MCRSNSFTACRPYINTFKALSSSAGVAWTLLSLATDGFHNSREAFTGNPVLPPYCEPFWPNTACTNHDRCSCHHLICTSTPVHCLKTHIHSTVEDLITRFEIHEPDVVSCCIGCNAAQSTLPPSTINQFIPGHASKVACFACPEDCWSSILMMVTDLMYLRCLEHALLLLNCVTGQSAAVLYTCLFDQNILTHTFPSRWTTSGLFPLLGREPPPLLRPVWALQRAATPQPCMLTQMLGGTHTSVRSCSCYSLQHIPP